MRPSVKKIYIFVAVIVIYFGAALALREYRMNPSSQYYGNYLPSSTPAKSTSEEETERMINALTRKPTFLEKLFEPAEFIFNLIGI